MQDRKQWAGNVALLLVSLAICLLLLELLYRFFLFGWSSLSVEKMNSLHGWGYSGMRQQSADLELVYELKPNLSTYFKMVPFATNSHGLRDKEYRLEKPRGTFRIAVVGDSFTVPSGVRIEDAYHSRLEDRLNQNHAQQNHVSAFEVINLSVPGYTLRQYLAVIRGRASSYDPDLILVGFCARNDHMGSLQGLAYQEKNEVDSFFESFVIKGLRHLRRAKQQDNNKLRRVRPSAEQRQYLARQVSATGAFSAESAVPIVFAFLDIRPIRLLFLKRALKKNGLFFVNATLPFKNREFADYTIHPLDSHPNGAANEIFAEVIYRYLAEERLIDQLRESTKGRIGTVPR